MIKNNLVMVEGINICDQIYSLDIACLKGKTVQCPVPHVGGYSVPVPPEILKLHKHLNLAIDIMFVNKIPFLLTRSWQLKFGTVEPLVNHQEPTVRDTLTSMLRMYHHRGFIIDNIYADLEFEFLQPWFPSLNTCGADDHVPDIE